MSYIYTVKYKKDGKVINSSLRDCRDYSLAVTEEHEKLTVILQPKIKLELIDFSADIPVEFQADDFFFANGYQSWTTTREYQKNNIQKGYIHLAKMSAFTRHLAAISADQYFIDYSEKPGEFHSHCYTYIRSGKNVKLWGSVSEKVGYTYFKANMQKNEFAVHKDLEGKTVTEPLTVLDLVCFEGSYDEVFDRYFALYKTPATKTGSMSGYTSWYNYFQKINEDIILRDLNGMDRAKDEVSIFQVDDGYETFVGDWLDPNPEKFPHGMGYIADRIHAKGYKAGIWLAPFSCQRTSRVAKEHPDWLLKDKKGKPVLGCFGWGGAYTLDIYNEEARAYIRHFFDVVLNEWGYDMVKLDFLYSECMVTRNNKSRGEIMCEAMEFLRECVGDKLLLGCGVPIGPALGIVDACRISCDVDLVYGGKFYNKLHVNNEIPSAQNAIVNSLFRRHLNGRVFMNDPDVFFLRNDNLTFTWEQKLLLGEINNLCGNVLFVSDNAGDYDDRQLAQLKKFFKKTDERVTHAEYTGETTIRVEIKGENTERAFEFDLSDGRIISNQ